MKLQRRGLSSKDHRGIYYGLMLPAFNTNQLQELRGRNKFDGPKTRAICL